MSRLSRPAPSISDNYDIAAFDDTPVQSRFTQVDEFFSMAVGALLRKGYLMWNI